MVNPEFIRPETLLSAQARVFVDKTLLTNSVDPARERTSDKGLFVMLRTLDKVHILRLNKENLKIRPTRPGDILIR